MTDFADSIIAWYERNRRELPWRNTKNPFFIWLSEIILQQTRVSQGMNYYLKFVHHFPDIYALARASRDEVFKLWQGLGYYNRAENMLKTAKLITEKHDGKFPRKQSLLMELPGIGPYTSAAIASIAFNEPIPVVDGNVFRVIARLYGIHEPVNSSKGVRIVHDVAAKLMGKKSPGTFNQAIMEFGALACTPVNPGCENCPFQSMCFAYLNGETGELPVRQPKIKIKNRYFYYFHIGYFENDTAYLYLNKRTGNDIWKNLYDFLLVETTEKITITDEWISSCLKGKFNLGKGVIGKLSKEYRQRLTHQLIHAEFIQVIVDKKITRAPENSLILVPEDHLINYPVPRLIEQYLTDEKIIK